MSKPFKELIDKMSPESKERVSDKVALLESTLLIEKMAEALKKLRDCDWKITLPDRMDGVREIASEALSLYTEWKGARG